ncbi:MAG: rhodanese-like domain-containing protein [Phycisphaerales bacterium]|jgi:rhodanese-related sulfurtransferase|nr:rhodanese-like domain-containing protein [Phycisphaerales bacterium]
MSIITNVLRLTPIFTPGRAPATRGGVPSVRSAMLALSLAVGVVVGGGLGGCTKTISDADIEKDAVTLKDVRRAVDRPGDGTLLIDARPRKDWETARIPSSINLSMTQISGREGERDPRLSAFNKIIVFGDNPGSSAARAMTKKMIMTGYDDVHFFPGGLFEWQGANLPTRQGPPGGPAETRP